MKYLKKCSKMALMFYIFSFIMFMIFIFSCYNVTVYVQSLISAGSLSLSESLMDVVLYYVNNTTSYLAYALIILGIGYMISNLKTKTKDNEVKVVETTSQVEE